MSFNAFRNSVPSAATLARAAKATASRGRSKDERFWSPTADASGAGSFIIRFLPAIYDPTVPPEEQPMPWVEVYNYGIHGPDTGLWYIENCRTTLNPDNQDPANDYARKLWAKAKTDADKTEARKYSRRIGYISNILVIKDTNNPDNEGKVFCFRYGVKIFDKIKEALEPKYDGEEPIQVFDFDHGADFLLRFKKKGGYRNYDDSRFGDQEPLFDGDEKLLEKVYNQITDLREFVDENGVDPNGQPYYYSYEELKKKFDRVMGFDTLTGQPLNSGVATAQKVAQRVTQTAHETSEDGPGVDRDDPARSSAYDNDAKPSGYSEDEDEEDDPVAYFKKRKAAMERS